MPGFDGTGPDFAGPMTGGAYGWCTDESRSAGVGYGRARGFGRGRRVRQGRGNWPGMGFGRDANRFVGMPEPVVDGEAVRQQLEQQAMARQRC